MRIVSLLPSATEIVCELGLGDNLVGVTHECDYPPSVARLPRVTKTLIPHDASSLEIDSLVRERLRTQKALYSLDMPTLESLRPELIVTQSLCEVCAVAQSEVNAAVSRLPGNPTVINLEPTSLKDVFDCLQVVGDKAGISDVAEEVVGRLQHRVDQVVGRADAVAVRPRVVLLEWIDPLFSSGHWSPELVRLAGGVEVVGKEEQRSRGMTWQELADADPDFLVIACCGFNVERTRADLPILSSHPGFEQLTCVRKQNVFVVDGNAYFSRPGPRLVDSLEILANILNPEGQPLPESIPAAQRLTLEELGLQETQSS